MKLSEKDLYEVTSAIEQGLIHKDQEMNLLSRYEWDDEMVEQVESFIEQRSQGFQFVREWVAENFTHHDTVFPFCSGTGYQSRAERKASVQKLVYKTILMLLSQQEMLAEVVKPAVEDYNDKEEDLKREDWMIDNLETAINLLEEAIDEIGAVSRELHS